MKDKIKTIIVDLTSSNEELFKRIHKNARWGIRKAQKENLEILYNEDFEEFYKIYLDAMKSKNLTPFFLEEIQKEMIVFLNCKYKDKIIAGLVIGINEDSNLPEIMYNASLPEFQKFQPNDLLYWMAILWAKYHGYKKIDLGGYSTNPYDDLMGINKFKEKWSGQIEEKEIDYPFLHAIQRKLLRKSPLFRKIKANLRRIINKQNKVYERAWGELK